jgi:alkylation response protein AidB-like acyl-CoA dehydrogenase
MSRADRQVAPAGEPDRWGAVLEFERFLGNPARADSILSYKRALELDEAEEYPEKELAQLDAWGLQKFYMPVALGGRLRDYEELSRLVCSLARRDCSLPLAHMMSFVAATVAWLGGTDEQRKKVARLIENGERLAVMLHEKEHGSDLLACEVTARPTEQGYELAGEKWVVGNASRCRAMVVFAKTSERGERSFSLLLIDKRDLDRKAYEEMLPLKTHGVRAHEVGGIRFDNCAVPANALIGGEGRGLELVLLCSNITRVVATSVSLGACETALRLAVDFARQRRIYGYTVFNLPYPRRIIVRAFTDLLVSDCLILSATRALHLIPQQASVFAASLKSLVPGLLERTVASLSEVLGARSFLREGHPWSIFQKILRDISIVRLAHFGTTVSRSHLAAQLYSLVKHRRQHEPSDLRGLDATFARLFCLREPLREFDAKALELAARGDDELILGLRHALERLKGQSDSHVALLKRLEILVAHLARLDNGVEDLRKESPRNFGRSPKLFDMAEAYSALHAASACVQLWLHNRGMISAFFDEGDWLVLSLDSLLRQLSLSHLLEPDPEEDARAERVAAEILRRFDEEQSFTLLPLPLYGRADA